MPWVPTATGLHCTTHGASFRPPAACPAPDGKPCDCDEDEVEECAPIEVVQAEAEARGLRGRADVEEWFWQGATLVGNWIAAVEASAHEPDVKNDKPLWLQHMSLLGKLKDVASKDARSAAELMKFREEMSEAERRQRLIDRIESKPTRRGRH